MEREEGVAEEFAKRSKLLSFILLLGLIYLVDLWTWEGGVR